MTYNSVHVVVISGAIRKAQLFFVSHLNWFLLVVINSLLVYQKKITQQAYKQAYLLKKKSYMQTGSM